MIQYNNDSKDEEKILIKLSLRGKIFTVERDVLLKVKGTYFYGLLSSGAWQPNTDGLYVIDRPNVGFDRILDCLSTGKLNCEGLSEYDIECVYDNLDYFLVPFTRVWDYTKVTRLSDFKLSVRLQLTDGMLCGNTIDKTICMYNLDTNRIETTIEGYTKDIRVIIQLFDGRLCSCCSDNDIKIWNIESGHCDLTISHARSYTHCLLQLRDGRLCSNWYSSNIKIYSIFTGECELTIKYYASIESLVQLRDGRICGAGESGLVKMWDISDLGDCCSIFDDDSRYPNTTALVVIDEMRLCGYALNGDEFKIWNLGTKFGFYKCEKTFKNRSGISNMILLSDGRLCCACRNGRVTIWNIDSGVCDLNVQVSDIKRNFHNRPYPFVMQLHDGRLLLSDENQSEFIMGSSGSKDISWSRCSLC